MEEFTFHEHEAVGAVLAAEVLGRLKIGRKAERQDVVFLVENHMRAHRLSEMGRPKVAELLRHRAARELLQLMEADNAGKLPFLGDVVEREKAVAERFFAEDRVLQDLGVNGSLLLKLGETPGRKLAAKLRQMQALLDKDPTKTRAELLQAVGLQET